MKHAFLCIGRVYLRHVQHQWLRTRRPLCPGCSDPYVASLNYNQGGIGSRAWVNPFTGSFPIDTPNNHAGHTHTGTSHRVTVAMSDLIPAQNPGATYFAEGHT